MDSQHGVNSKPPKDMNTSKSLRDLLIAYASHAGIVDPEVTDRYIEAIVEAVEGLIGQDEPVKEIEGRSIMHNELAHKNAIQNELRAELREAIKEWQ